MAKRCISQSQMMDWVRSVRELRMDLMGMLLSLWCQYFSFSVRISSLIRVKASSFKKLDSVGQQEKVNNTQNIVLESMNSWVVSVNKSINYILTIFKVVVCLLQDLPTYTLTVLWWRISWVFGCFTPVRDFLRISILQLPFVKLTTALSWATTDTWIVWSNPSIINKTPNISPSDQMPTLPHIIVS